MSDHKLIVEFKNRHPIEVERFTASLTALGNQFKRFVSEHEGVDPETRLYVHEIRPGSIIAELVELGKSANDLWEARDYIAPFLPVLQDLVETVLRLTPKAKLLDKPTIRNVANFVSPIAGDNNGQINLIDNRGGVVVNQFTVTPAQASAIAYNAQHLLNSDFPDEQRFINEPMVIFQGRDAPPGKSGDYGIIDRFSPRHLKLTFGSDAVKQAILHESGHPFEQVFWVTGVVKTAGGNPVAYQRHELVETSPKAA